MFVLLLFTFFSVVSIYWYFATKRPKHYPPGPNWLPIVGSYFMLRKMVRKHGTLSAVFQSWQREYKSDVIGFKLGNELIVVGLTHPIFREVHSNNAFDGRPDNFFFRLRSFGQRLGVTGTDGALWWEQRNFVLRHLKRCGFGRNLMEEQVQFELNKLVDKISGLNETPVWPGKLFSCDVLSVLWMFVAGEQLSNDDPYLMRLMDLMKRRGKAFDHSGGWLNVIPFLRFIAPEKSSYNLIKRFNEETRNFFSPIIEDHKKRFSADKVDDDLIFAFINEMKMAGDESNFTDAQLIMVILDLFMGGSETTSYTLDFTMLMLVLHPEVQSKCHQEIDDVLGKAQLPSLKDKSKLSYIEATIFETQRIWNVISF